MNLSPLYMRIWFTLPSPSSSILAIRVPPVIFICVSLLPAESLVILYIFAPNSSSYTLSLINLDKPSISSSMPVILRAEPKYTGNSFLSPISQAMSSSSMALPSRKPFRRFSSHRAISSSSLDVKSTTDDESLFLSCSRILFLSVPCWSILFTNMNTGTW